MAAVAVQVQSDWWRCTKCLNLFFRGNQTPGRCAAGGGHDATLSNNYAVAFTGGGGTGQSNWRWCRKCQGLFFHGNPNDGRCPMGGPHDASASGDYTVSHGFGMLGFPPLIFWRWCHKCQGLFYAGLPAKGRCPAGGAHDASKSGEYGLFLGF